MRPANGTEKAALVLLALGGEHGAPIWREFDDGDVAALGAAIARLGTVEQTHAGAALSLFFSELAAKAGFMGNTSAAELLIAKVLPEERAHLALDHLRRPLGPDLWERVAALDDDVILRHLASEHPQTTALVLSQLPPARAAKLLASLSPDAAVAALRRFSRLSEIDRQALSTLEKSLSESLVGQQKPAEASAADLRMASIFDAIAVEKAEELLGLWSQHEQATAERIRSLMFTFDDFRLTTSGNLQVLMRSVDRDVLAIALKGVAEDIRVRFTEQMSARAARMFEDQMTTLGSVRRKDVQAAQAKILELARRLEAAGDLSLRPAAEAEAEDMLE